MRLFRLGKVVALVLAAGVAGCAGGGATIASGGGPGVRTSASPSGGSPTATPTPLATSTPSGGSGGSASTVSAGPAMLYMAPAVAPQLVNTGIWVAQPILISGASSYRSGEYVYQGFLYDDHGAKGVPDTAQPDEIDSQLFAIISGTYTYPVDARYGANAANLVEFRMKLTDSATAFRVTFNTMIDPTAEAFTIGLGGGSTSYAMPHSANASEPAKYFITVHGTAADVVDAATGTVVSGASPSVSVDQTHRQVTVLLPFATYDTRGNTALRVAVAAGLWNETAGTYLVPQTSSDGLNPGGAGSTAPAAFFDVGFRHAEPSGGIADTSQTGTQWREYAQAAALASGDISSFYDLVDMTKLAAGANDDMIGQPQGVPQNGHMDRILSSHFEPFQGRRYLGCDGAQTACAPELGSALQPYAIYVPKEPPPPGGYQMTLLLHAANSNYNQFANTRNESELGERAVPSIVITTEGRGPDVWYQNLAESEVFEAWADAKSRYPIDPTKTAVTGYSMGGYATFKLAARYPDLFGRMELEVGGTATAGGGNTYTDTASMFGTYRNIPILVWQAGQDELLLAIYSAPEETNMSNLGLNFEYDLLSPAEHLTMGLNDQFAPVATFLGTASVEPNPAHVTFVLDPQMDNASEGIVSDHAYWLSGVTQRDKSQTYATVDVFSHGFGVGDPPTSGTQPTTGMLSGGNLPTCCTLTGFKNTYGAVPTAPVSDSLTITATDIAAVTIAPARARVDCNAQLNVTTDGPLTVTLAGCAGGGHSFGAGKVRRGR